MIAVPRALKAACSIGFPTLPLWVLIVQMLLPGCAALAPDPASAPNDCLIVAVRAQAELPAGTWSRRLIVSYAPNALSHAYLVFELRDASGAKFKAYDARGTRAIYPASRSALDLMRATDPYAVSAHFDEDAPR